jgi:hypothetical protein
MTAIQQNKQQPVTAPSGCGQKVPMQNPEEMIESFCRECDTDSFFPDEPSAMFQTFWLAIQAAARTALAYRREGGCKWHLRGSEGSPTWLVQRLDELTRDIAEAAAQDGSEFPGPLADHLIDFANGLNAASCIFLAAERSTLATLRSKADWFLPQDPTLLQEQPE